MNPKENIEVEMEGYRKANITVTNICKIDEKSINGNINGRYKYQDRKHVKLNNERILVYVKSSNSHEYLQN